MEERNFDGASRPEFWLAHVRAGVVLTETACIAVLVYMATEPQLDNRAEIAVIVIAVMVATAAILLLPLRTVLAHPRAPLFFYGWSSVAALATTAGCLLSGGTHSPIVALYFVMLVYAATSYPPAAVVRVAGGVLTLFILMALGDPSTFSSSIVVAGSLGLTAWMCEIAARNQWHQLQEQISLARVDGLTGCLNHRAFNDALEAEVERAHRLGRPLSLALVDLDDFKLVNDQRGHLAGDDVLSSLGHRLRGAVRAIDVVGRIGGDEFALLLIEMELSDAVEVGTRVRLRARESDDDATTTVSVGVAQLTEGGTATSLLRDADQALYAAKRSGRDAVRLAPADAPTGDPRPTA